MLMDDFIRSVTNTLVFFFFSVFLFWFISNAFYTVRWSMTMTNSVLFG